MLPQKIAFVDIETTGGRSLYDRIIEIGIIRVEDNKVVKTFNTLINPQTHLPKEIIELTGINESDLDNAPTFRLVKDDILEMLEDCVFVAHNVRFDYGFLKQEYRRENITFTKKHFCTVRLSRLLYPTYQRHNLDALIDRFNFKCTNRHRALDDAIVLFDFYKMIQNQFPVALLNKTVSMCMRKPTVPLRLDGAMLDNLPESPGVYIFYSETGMPLYVGKSINLKDRVLSHFSSDIHSPTEMNISQQVASIETFQTAGELGALLLESRLIKKLLPLYNKVSRIKQELVALKCTINELGYKQVHFEPITTIHPGQIGIEEENRENFLGFFKSKKQAKNYLSSILNKHLLCDKLLGLEKTTKACFSYRLDKCKGACMGLEKPLFYNLRFTQAFLSSAIKPWPFNGPIVIEEKELEGKREYFLVDKWCYLGNVAVSEYDGKKDDLENKLIFDLDTYKILKRYLRNERNLKNIYQLNEKQFPLLNTFEEA